MHVYRCIKRERVCITHKRGNTRILYIRAVYRKVAGEHTRRRTVRIVAFLSRTTLPPPVVSPPASAAAKCTCICVCACACHLSFARSLSPCVCGISWRPCVNTHVDDRGAKILSVRRRVLSAYNIILYIYMSSYHGRLSARAASEFSRGTAAVCLMDKYLKKNLKKKKTIIVRILLLLRDRCVLQYISTDRS